MFMKSFKLRRRLVRGEPAMVTEDDVKEIEKIVEFMQNFSAELKVSEDKRKI